MKKKWEFHGVKGIKIITSTTLLLRCCRRLLLLLLRPFLPFPHHLPTQPTPYLQLLQHLPLPETLILY
ncbi:hypothetical protein KY289_024344 [Solanum tuberosum]|nr:hypothetical protein KY289_024344 [Solanum tuberosum]